MLGCANVRTYGHSVDPNHVCTCNGDSITAPDVVGVQLGDLDVLNDDVRDAAI
jgi:hypothetical protein